MFNEVIVLTLLFVSSFILTKLVCYFALKRKWFDVPDSRSSHFSPKLKCGGIAFSLVFFCLCVFMFYQGGIQQNEFLALLCGLLIAILGFIDDLFNLSIKIRFSIHSVAVLLALYFMGGAPDIPFFSSPVHFQGLGLKIIGYILATFIFAWIINLYNFMDGIDGIAGLEGMFVSIAAGLLIIFQEANSSLSFILFSLGASIAGFLILNLPPAKIFMGDVGSNFLGFILGVLGLITIKYDLMNVWTWGILLGVFVVDGTVTLLGRMRSEKLWYHAHRSHAYQKAAIQFNSHWKVDVYVLLINVFWLFPLAWLSIKFDSFGILITIFAYLPLVILVRRFRRA